MTHPESRLQTACLKWFRLQYPKELIYAIPNGGRRSAIEAAIMAGEGVTPGVPDLFLARPRFGKAGLFIEMKTPKGRLTDRQRQIQQALIYRDYAVVTCRSFDEFRAAVESYLNN